VLPFTAPPPTSLARARASSRSRSLSLSLSLSLAASLSLSLSLSLSRICYWSYWSFNEQSTAATHVGCPCPWHVIRKEAWPFYRTSSGVRLCWELGEPKGPKGSLGHNIEGLIAGVGGEEGEHPL